MLTANQREYQQNKEVIKKRATEWNAANKDRRRDIIRRSRHGITTDQYYCQLVDQNNVCAGCLEPPKLGTRLHIDHDHNCCPSTEKACGKCFRGLLCGSCNRLLGLAKDNPQILENLRDYLIYGPFGKKLERVD